MQAMWASAVTLPTISDGAFATSFKHLGEAHIVLLGDASHGTREFYTARAAITKMLIQDHGFKALALEADWAAVRPVDKFVRQLSDETWSEGFQDFGNWIWNNEEFAALVDWLRHWNAGRCTNDRIGIYGLDFLDAPSAMDAALPFLEHLDPLLADDARQCRAVMTSYRADPKGYASSRTQRERNDGLLLSLLYRIRHYASEGLIESKEHWFEALMGVLAASNEVDFDRAVKDGFAARWNARDTHMFEALCAICDHRGPAAKIVIWAHNNHVADAAYSELGRQRGQTSLGEMVRRRFGHRARLVGFGTNTGTVAAARQWGGAMETLSVPQPMTNSWEDLCHGVNLPRFLLELRGHRDGENAMRLGRTMGTVYQPEQEREDCYLELDLRWAFDTWVWIDETSALQTLARVHAKAPRSPDRL